MTGTPLDLTPFGGLLAALGWLYWLIALGIILVALWWPKQWWVKAVCAAVVAGAVVYPVFVRPVEKRVDAARAEQEAFKSKLDAAMARFEMRCKSAGEKIVRTVENVEGVVWMKWRDNDLSFNDQFKLDDPLGKDCGAEECIAQLLRLETQSGRFEREVALRKGRYRFVESVDPSDGRLRRYSGAMKLPVPPWTPEAIARQEKADGKKIDDYSYRFFVDGISIERHATRYGITWDDISTREDREFWIAGSSLRVIDLQTNDVIAERTGYLVDTGQGNTAGFRTPWSWAKSYAPRCPRTNESTLEFAVKVLQPNK